MSEGMLCVTVHYKDTEEPCEHICDVEDVFLEAGGLSLFYGGRNMAIIPVGEIRFVEVREQDMCQPLCIALRAKRNGRQRMTINIHLPITTYSEANKKEGWRIKAKRTKSQRGDAEMLTNAHIGMHSARDKIRKSSHITIHMTRLIAKGRVELDTDNLQRALKAIRDGIADALQIDDGDRKLTWAYAQEKSKEAGVNVQITMDVV